MSLRELGIVAVLVVLIFGLGAWWVWTSEPSQNRPAVIGAESTSTTAVTRDFVSINGDIPRPGNYVWNGERTLTLRQLIASAGGDVQQQDWHVEIRRVDGSRRTFQLSPPKPSDGEPIYVEQSDQIVVVRSKISVAERGGTVAIHGDLSRPGNFVLPDDQRLTIHELLVTAGWQPQEHSLWRIAITFSHGGMTKMTISSQQLRVLEDVFGQGGMRIEVEQVISNLSSPTASSDYVYVSGAVEMPGAYHLTDPSVKLSGMLRMLSVNDQPDDEVQVEVVGGNRAITETATLRVFLSGEKDFEISPGDVVNVQIVPLNP